MSSTLLEVPDLSLVVLVGASGSGKSTFAAQHFGPFEVVSSDHCRGLVADDVNDQAATADAFDVLHHIAGVRLRRGNLTVVDATNVQPDARRQLVALAREHDVLPVAVVLDLPERVCLDRNAARADRDFGGHVVKRQRDALRRSLRSLRREGFRTVHVLSSVEEVAAARVVRTPLRSDRRDEHGPFDVVGDVHGCLSELETLLGGLGYEVVRDERGRPVDATHPEGRRAVFLGDLVDRGPDSPGVLRLVMGMVEAGHALAVPGNHEAKLVRALDGRDVTVSHGLETTLAQIAAIEDDDERRAFRERVRGFADGLVSHLVLDEGKLVVAHAGLKEAYHNRASGRVRSFALYGDTTGESDEFGLPVRLDWARDYRGRATVLYGHVPTPELEWVNNTLCLDTGVVFGGKLSALRWPERETVQVPAEAVHYEPVKPLVPQASEQAVRDDDDLALTDVVSVDGAGRGVETRLAGRVAVAAEQAAGALEVMSRFAVDPHLLWYLPATMAPAGGWAEAPDLLEHPQAAFEAYRKVGVTDLLCEEKHMGSRAVVLVARSQEGFAAWTGTTAGGVVHTRTGRSFFGDELTVALLDGVRAAAERAGLWDELCGTVTGASGEGGAADQWLLLDAELLPWSAKAEELLRGQYAAVGAAARAALPAAVVVLEQSAARGLDVGALLERTRRREVDAAAFTEAYRRYVWPTGVGEGRLDGVQLAPFQVLAAGTAGGASTFGDRDHGWHLSVADRLVEAAPALFRTTRRFRVDAADAASCEAGTAWWTELTGAGGEGMVVKPFAGAALRGQKGLVQPGVKVRGAEYLRLIYGPGYAADLERLKQRQLGRKRSLALREHALGHESLARLADGEPLWRVHEAVFAVLALESEPVDPRL
ncbi:polynucleotide kinase-phosphatase [Quadrisphaera setariae]|uniref:Polynucleotide kinase-phosphatase n=1 Tax=Quadrisphaera setariae TaxID=2593304 RepID=A0A5C8ZFV8_9ACTN|nr:polynucleotide kinase-phosphatase [Quadrisphaera setariae]TXR56925.1 polynucleotide kinase-phosphatase [Quadrisphaera setariae]